MLIEIMGFGKRPLAVVTIGLIALVTACNKSAPAPAPAATNQEAQTQSSPQSQASPLSQFESDLKYVRNGMFTYVWVFARKDGKQLDKDDAAFLRKNAPQVVDWVGTDNGRKFIGGTNFDLEQGNMSLLKKRFQVEDYSGK